MRIVLSHRQHPPCLTACTSTSDSGRIGNRAFLYRLRRAGPSSNGIGCRASRYGKNGNHISDSGKNGNCHSPSSFSVNLCVLRVLCGEISDSGKNGNCLHRSRISKRVAFRGMVQCVKIWPGRVAHRRARRPRERKSPRERQVRQARNL